MKLLPIAVKILRIFGADDGLLPSNMPFWAHLPIVSPLIFPVVSSHLVPSVIMNTQTMFNSLQWLLLSVFFVASYCSIRFLGMRPFNHDG
jgi:hypothetical protein